MIEQGMKAPDFTLEDKDGNQVSLSQFLGQKVILYFYPRDNTPGCTAQACGFRDAYDELQGKAVVIGVSKDSAASHQKFAQKYQLPFVLLSDPQRQPSRPMGVWQEKRLYGKTSMGVARTTFLIDEKGVVEKVFQKVKAAENARGNSGLFGRLRRALFMNNGRLFEILYLLMEGETVTASALARRLEVPPEPFTGM